MTQEITVLGEKIDHALLEAYFDSLVNRFFKILPMREENEQSLATYLRSLQMELLGCKGFLPSLSVSADYLSLLAILQFFVDSPESELADVRREVFKAIRICNKLRAMSN